MKTKRPAATKTGGRREADSNHSRDFAGVLCIKKSDNNEEQAMDEQPVEESIEFQEIDNDLLLTTVARSSFRIPVMERTDFSIVINEKSYSLANISAGGIAVLIDSKSSFFLGQILPDCELILANESVKGLKGKVAHCSSYVAGKWLYGIEWIDTDPVVSKKIADILLVVRKELFKNNQL